MYIIILLLNIFIIIIKSIFNNLILTIIVNENKLTPYELIFNSIYKNIHKNSNQYILTVNINNIKFIKKILIFISRFICINIFIINYEISIINVFLYYEMTKNNIKINNIFFNDNLSNGLIYYYINDIKFINYLEEIKPRLTREQIQFYKNTDTDILDGIGLFIDKYNLSENTLWTASFEGSTSLNMFKKFYNQYKNIIHNIGK
jgi:hypothetical protein